MIQNRRKIGTSHFHQNIKVLSEYVWCQDLQNQIYSLIIKFNK